MTKTKSVGVVLAALGALLLAVGLMAPASADGNIGTLKVTEDSECGGPDNNPKVDSPYYFGGFGFPASESFTITIETQPGDEFVDELAGVTDSEGAFCLGPVTTPDGMYKATFTDSEGDKSKVYQVGVGIVTPPPTTEPPTTEPPTTEPPTTEPPTTEPPTTEPPTTEPPTTEPPSVLPTDEGGTDDSGDVVVPPTTDEASVLGVKLADTGASGPGLMLIGLAVLALGALMTAAGSLAPRRH